MTTTWAEVALGDICELKYGKSLPKGKRSGEGFGVYGSNGEVGKHRESLTAGTTLIVGRKGSFGEVTYSHEPCWPIDTTYFVDETATDADLRWLYYRVKALPLTKLNRAAAIPGLNREDAYAQRVLLPPLDEQRRIAAVLDAADGLRVKRRQALALVDRLAQSMFVEMFGDPVLNPSGWPVVKLVEVLARIDSGKSPVCHDRPATTDEWGVLKAGAVTYCVYDDTQHKALPEDIEPLQSMEVRPGDVLFSRKNTHDLVAACAYVQSTRPRLQLSDLIFRLVIGEEAELEPLFLQQMLIHPRQRRQVQRLAGGSAGSMPNISKAKLKSVSICLPPADIQAQFVRRVEAVSSARCQSRSGLRHLDDLFGSLQQRAFRGEL